MARTIEQVKEFVKNKIELLTGNLPTFTRVAAYEEGKKVLALEILDYIDSEPPLQAGDTVLVTNQPNTKLNGIHCISCIISEKK